MQLTGLHHVSSLTAHAPENVAFYTDVLGLRLVKKTVNQDDPSSYHLFYGDEVGNPGTEVTFFDIPHAAQNRPGTDSIARIGLRVPNRDALSYWLERLDAYSIDHDGIAEEGGRAVLAFRDYEGQRLALLDDHDARVPGGVPWDKSTTPTPVAIRGLGTVNLVVRDLAPTARTLTEVMGFREARSYPTPDARTVVVFETGAGGVGAEVHVEERSDVPRERLGRGGVHHVAFRVPDDQEYAAWLERLASAGVRTSGPVDRFYFRSIYFREPNGILFELATDGPGFATDEDRAHLGEQLALPPFLEGRRAEIERMLKPLATA
jgi:glyoxalase family protein